MRRLLIALALGAAAAALFVSVAAAVKPVSLKQARAFAGELADDLSMDRYGQHCAALAPAFRARTFGHRSQRACVAHWELNAVRGIRLDWRVTGAKRRADGTVLVRVVVDQGAWLVTVTRIRGRLLAVDIRAEG